jgi:hypothetical protein
VVGDVLWTEITTCRAHRNGSPLDRNTLDHFVFLQGLKRGRNAADTLHTVGEFCGGSEFLDLEAEYLRLWSIHPQYLDGIGLVALWRESLLAQKILKEQTKGYRNHPQLKRFRIHPRPQRAIAGYLIEIWQESRRRGYNFDKKKIGGENTTVKIPVNRGQLRYEFDWLLDKLKKRDLNRYNLLRSVKKIDCHPALDVIEGGIEEWEKLELG